MVDYENPWMFNGKPFTSMDIGDNIGFVYIIEDVYGKKYIGKKILMSKRRLPPLKGKTRRRTKIVESDWKKYYGSSEVLNENVAQYGVNSFQRTVLHLCKKKGEMSYLELHEQITRNVLFDDAYYNGIVQVKIHRSHVQGLKEWALQTNKQQESFSRIENII
jgi:hypothetical protein